MLSALRTTNPFAEMNALQREMNRLFENFAPEGVVQRQTYPPVNIWRSEDGVGFTVYLPGYGPDDVEITMNRNTLTIRGQRLQPELSNGQALQRNERHYGQFLRTFEIPFDVEAAKTDATFDKGVLLISLERSEEEKPKKVQIKVG